MIKVIVFTIEHGVHKTDFESNPSEFIETLNKSIVKFEAEVDNVFVKKFTSFLEKELGLNKREKKKKE